MLFASGIRPIVLIAFTNHALDHMLTSVLDANITKKFVRLGSRSSDDRIAEFTLDKLEKITGGSSMLDRPIKRQYAIMKKLEEEMLKVMESIQLPGLTWNAIEKFLEIHYPEQAECLNAPPYWIEELRQRTIKDEENNGEWKTAGKKRANDGLSQSIYGFWRDGRDIEFISPPPPQVRKGKKKSQLPTPEVRAVSPDVVAFFESLGFGPCVPPIPTGSRPIQQLLRFLNVWSLSLDERHRLSTEWEERIRHLAYESNLQQYEEKRVEYREACKEYNDIKDETRRRLLSQTDLIGCTTTGAAKLTSLLSNISPKVLMVEEAGQVLEAHILTSLVSSVHHLICIGDPQQLRPTLATAIYGQ